MDNPGDRKAVLLMPRFPKYLTVEETAKALRRSVNSIYMSRSKGQAPGSLGVKTAGKVLFDVEVLEEWIDSGGRSDWSPNGR